MERVRSLLDRDHSRIETEGKGEENVACMYERSFESEKRCFEKNEGGRFER